MNPRMRPDLLPRFHEDLSPEAFENLTRDLFGKEPGIRSSELYGRSGQGQLGIDVLAYREGGVELEVGQCKRVAEFTPAIFEAAISKFLESLDHWKSRNVRRFVIFVACPIRDTEVQEVIINATARFSGLGITLEVWDAQRLIEKLRPHSVLVENHCGLPFVKLICGTTIESRTASPAAAIIGGMAAGHAILSDCITEFSDTYDQELPTLRELARSGRAHEAYSRLQNLRRSPRWPLLSPRHQALGLRLAASLTLDHLDDTATAKKLLKEAKTVGPEENYQVLETVICYRESGSQVAIQMVNNPRDLDSWNLKLALLTDTGHYQEVLGLMENPDFAPNGESFRIASVSALLADQFSKAQAFASEALRLNPSWFQIRLHAAKLQYLGTLLTHFPMMKHLEWPVPPDWEYVRRDAASLLTLRLAEQEFQKLAEMLKNESPERAQIEGWRLACLANDPTRRDEAERLANQLLEKNPTHHSAGLWSLHRGFPIDPEKYRTFFSNRDRELSPDTAQYLCTLHIHGDNFDQAITVLDQAKSSFEKKGALFAWRLVRAQLLMETGAQDQVEQLILEEKDSTLRRDIRIAILRTEARKTGDYTKFANALSEAYREARTPRYLFEACEAALRAGRPEFVADYAEQLLSNFPTSSGLQLAVQGAFDAQRFALCLRLLRDHSDYFADEFPATMKRVEIECLRQVGELAAAAEQAETLARKFHDTESLLSLFQTQVTINDFPASVVTVRELLKREDLTSFGLLQMAHAIHVEDRILAVECWNEAVRRGLTDQVDLCTAVNLAFRLGLEKAAAPLMPRFYELAQTSDGPVQAKPFEEIQALIQEVSEHRGNINQKFNECQIPAHLAVEGLGCHLGTLYHETPAETREHVRLAQTYPLMVRHGAREQKQIPKVGVGVFADITSLMLAAEIDLLETVERAFAPILISAHLPECLRHQIEKASPNQPGLETTRSVVTGIIKGKRVALIQLHPAPSDILNHYSSDVLNSWSSLLARARDESGLLCDFVPPITRSGHLAKIRPEDRPYLVSCGDLVSQLQEIRAISEKEAKNAKDLLGSLGAPFNAEVTLTPGRLVLLSKDTAEALANTGLLDALASFARVEMSYDDFEAICTLQKEYAKSIATVEWLKALASRIHRGIQRNTYRTVTNSERSDEHYRDPRSQEEHCLYDHLSADKLGATVAWCDDRFMSRYERIGGLPNLGVSEILRQLRKSGRLNESEYFAYLHNLRASNARYLPLEAEELQYHIVRAPVINGEIQETPALTTLRRYFAACCLDKARMRPPGQLNGRQVLGEFTWFADSLRASTEAIGKLWAANLPESECEARAEWLLQELVVPLHGVAEAHSGQAQPQNGADGISGVLGLLFASGFTLPSPWKRDLPDLSHPRACYWNWLAERLIEPTLKVEPELISRLATFLSNGWLKTPKGKFKNDVERKVLRGLAMRGWLDLPPAVREKIELDKPTKSWLGLSKAQQMVRFFGREFDYAAFWRTLSGAIIQGSAKLQAEGTEEYYTFSAIGKQSPPRRIAVRGPGLPDRARAFETKAGVLVADSSVRQAFLRRHIDWFDIGAEKREKIVQKIASFANPARRIQEIELARSRSAEEFYLEFYRKLKSRESLTAEEGLPPSANSLCDHLRLREEDFSPENPSLDANAARLIDEIGLSRTIERFSSLPILLPPPILDAVRKLTTLELRELFSRLRRLLRTPLSRIHLCQLLSDRAASLPEYLVESQQVIKVLLNDEATREEWKTFAVILQWTARHFQRLPDFRSLDAQTRLLLTWLHASRLHNVLIRARVKSAPLRQAFHNSAEETGLDIPAHDLGYWHDAVHPRFAGRIYVLFRGLGAVLATLPEQIRAQLQLTDLPWGKNIPTSGLMLLHETSLCRNPLNSFMGGYAIAPLEALIQNSVLKSILPIEPPRILRQSLEELTASPDNLGNWVLLAATIGDRPLPSDLAATLNGLIGKIDFVQLVADKPEHEHVILHFICGRSVTGWPEEVIRHIEAQLWALTAQFEKSSQDGDLVSRRVNLLANCLVSIAVVAGDSTETYRRFYKYLAELAWRWPASVPVLKRRFHGWPANMPLDRHRGMWELELTLRALA